LRKWDVLNAVKDLEETHEMERKEEKKVNNGAI
jgi:hypothetical protein